MNERTAMPAKTQNAMLIIHPHKTHGTWCFDDERHGLIEEPFVLGASEMIDAVVARAGLTNADRGFRLIFSASPFPGYHAEIHRLNEESGGYWYQFPDGSMKGWLCPATLHYFPDQHPQRIYARAEAI